MNILNSTTRPIACLLLGLGLAGATFANPLTDAEALHRFSTGEAMSNACHTEAVRTKAVNGTACMQLTGWLDTELAPLAPALSQAVAADAAAAARYDVFLGQLRDIKRLADASEDLRALMDEARRQAGGSPAAP